MVSVLLTIVMAAGHRAAAAPPPPDSEDAQILAPAADWVRRQTDRHSNPCCDIGDGRPVDAEIATLADSDRVLRSHWRAHVTPAHFPGQPDHWVVVPDDKIITGPNPTGSPILWLYHGLVQCFAPPNGS
jgi:hypothetical protein